MSIGLERQLQLVHGQIVEWEEAQFNAELAHRVHTRIKSEKPVVELQVNRMIQAEMAIAELRGVEAELQRELEKQREQKAPTITTP